jgi:hypothetical protein
MKTTAKILLDSKIVESRITTFEIVFPRCVLSEFNTHRVNSKNTSSSRAIPFNKIVKNAKFEPEVWRTNNQGMQPKGIATPMKAFFAKIVWRMAKYMMITCSFILNRVLGIHKELSNRLIEPWMMVKMVVTASTWENFFNLRCHPDAQYEIEVLAKAMKEALENSTPVHREFHLPFVDYSSIKYPNVYDKQELIDVIKQSVARCARISYYDFNGQISIQKDIAMFDKLVGSNPIHASPAEHQVFTKSFAERILNTQESMTYVFNYKNIDYSGNLNSMNIVQLRKLIEKSYFK